MIGSLFTNGGFGNWGWGRNGGINSPAGAAAETLVLDGLSNITTQLNGVNTTLLNSQASQNQALCQGFSGINDKAIFKCISAIYMALYSHYLIA